jgi:6,7-dimethyl-8-ribityllumazine synthase
MKLHIAIVVADFNSEITSKMLASALAEAKRGECDVVKVIHVPGAYDSPLAAKLLLKDRNVDCVAVLGAIIKGGTKHDAVIANAIAGALTSLSLEFEKPVALGVMGPGLSYTQAKARAKGYAERAVLCAKQMALIQRR